MTRRKWTTTNQEEWLKTRLARFSDAQATKTTKDFFPAILKEWRVAWPCPGPSPEEITEAGNVEKATLKKRTEENAVHYLPHLKKNQNMDVICCIACKILVSQSYKGNDIRKWSAWTSENEGKAEDPTGVAGLPCNDV